MEGHVRRVLEVCEVDFADEGLVPAPDAAARAVVGAILGPVAQELELREELLFGAEVVDLGLAAGGRVRGGYGAEGGRLVGVAFEQLLVGGGEQAVAVDEVEVALVGVAGGCEDGLALLGRRGGEPLRELGEVEAGQEEGEVRGRQVLEGLVWAEDGEGGD